MFEWIVATLVLALIVTASAKGAAYIAFATGRTVQKPSTAYLVTVALGTGLSVLIVGMFIELPLAAKACVAGAAGGIFSLVALALFGERKP